MPVAIENHMTKIHLTKK